jgi:aliphatic nitrilase
MHDIVGHYQRFDVFKLHVDTTPHEPVTLHRMPSDRSAPIPRTMEIREFVGEGQ